jgi:hypothetical protein
MAGAGEIYRCERDGKVIFSQRPCGEDAQRMELETGPQPPANPVAPEPAAMDVDAYIQERRYRRRLEQLRGRRQALVEERDKRVAQLEAQIAQAPNYAIYGDIRREIHDTRKDYNQKIRQVDADIREHQLGKPDSLKSP